MASQGWGGAESVFVELSNALAGSHQVTALLLRGTQYRDRFSVDVDQVIMRSHPTRHNPFLSHEIFQCLKAIKPDIIHTHAVKGTELVFGVNRFLHIPHLATKHNVRKGSIFNRLDWVTAVSKASRETIRAKKSARVEVVFNGIWPVEIEDAGKMDVFTILAIGRLDKIKGFDRLIRQVHALDFDFQLLIIGEGPERRNLEDILQGSGMEEKVHLAGFREDIPQLMKKAHLVVVSSHTEGFSKVLVEGLFYADVVVSTPVGVAREILPPILLTDQEGLAAKINEVHRDFSRFTQEFAKIRKSRGKEFLFPSLVEKYNRLYREMVVTK